MFYYKLFDKNSQTYNEKVFFDLQEVSFYLQDYLLADYDEEEIKNYFEVHRFILVEVIKKG